VYAEVGKSRTGKDPVSAGGVPGHPLPTLPGGMGCLSPQLAPFNQPGVAFSLRMGPVRPPGQETPSTPPSAPRRR